jgi:hypothetical protein
MPHAFQERSSAHCERFAALRQRYYLMACAWCQKPIRWKRKATASPCEVSHGICCPLFCARVPRGAGCPGDHASVQGLTGEA